MKLSLPWSVPPVTRPDPLCGYFNGSFDHVAVTFDDVAKYVTQVNIREVSSR